jgi:Tfp pilus assembly protein PilV
VINNNPYTQDLFEQVFARVVAQTRESSNEANADIVWDRFVTPLKQNGKVPPDLAVYLWNCYFSKQFVSLPNEASVDQQCYRLSEIKKNIEKEYQLKRTGFQVSQQGDADTHFLNAMYVYNTMWAACHPQSK